MQLVPVLEERTGQQLRALLVDEVATRDTLKPAVCSLTCIATLIDALGCVPTIESTSTPERGIPQWPHPQQPRTPLRKLARRRQRGRQGDQRPAVLGTADPNKPSTPSAARTAFLRAIGRCNRAIGDWPDQREYALWQCIEADICRRTGTLERTPPSQSTIRKRLWTWPDALGLARRLCGVHLHYRATPRRPAVAWRARREPRPGAPCPACALRPALAKWSRSRPAGR